MPLGHPQLLVLGIAQDAGHPQPGCRQACCAPERGRHLPCSLALIDAAHESFWLLDASPALGDQLTRVRQTFPRARLRGIFLTHAHLGHYTGLLWLGREAMASEAVPVYAMPRMEGFLRAHAPWEQLVRLGNVRLVRLQADQPVELGSALLVTPWLVPHRDEYSETVAFCVRGPAAQALYLPDIDSWQDWQRPLCEVLAQVDVAWLDGTFYADTELPGRDPSCIPHPPIKTSLGLLAGLSAEERAKVRFIHLNHSNPVLWPSSPERQLVLRAGCQVARAGACFDLQTRSWSGI